MDVFQPQPKLVSVGVSCSICSYHAGNTFPYFATCGQFRPPNTFEKPCAFVNASGSAVCLETCVK